MRRAKTLSILTAVCFLLLPLLSADTFAADRRPYFKGVGGDVMSGGWFTEGGTCNTSYTVVGTKVPKYQDSGYVYSSGTTNPFTGGILGYAKSVVLGSNTNSDGGASSEYAAFVLGQIEGNTGARFGFYSNGSLGGPVGGRTFANNSNAPWGGLFQDDSPSGVRQSYCIPDYFSKKPNPNPPALASLTNATANGLYYANPGGGVYTLNSSNIALGTRKITVFVDGDVYIAGNITYDVNSAVESDLPKLAVIAKGNIYIAPGVTDLYGFYVAQPDHANNVAVVDNDGVIWTCHPGTIGDVFYTWPVEGNRCGNKLTITGGLAAKQINFLRINGDVVSASTAEDGMFNAAGDPLPGGALSSGNIAEVIHYAPATVLDGPFFTPASTSGVRNKIDSVISLPPIF